MGICVTFEPGARSLLACPSAGSAPRRHRRLRLGAALGRARRGNPPGRRRLDSARREALAWSHPDNFHDPHRHLRVSRRQRRELDGAGERAAVSKVIAGPRGGELWTRNRTRAATDPGESSNGTWSSDSHSRGRGTATVGARCATLAPRARPAAPTEAPLFDGLFQHTVSGQQACKSQTRSPHRIGRSNSESSPNSGDTVALCRRLLARLSVELVSQAQQLLLISKPRREKTMRVPAEIAHGQAAATCSDAEPQMSTRTRTWQCPGYCGGSQAEASAFPAAS